MLYFHDGFAFTIDTDGQANTFTATINGDSHSQRLYADLAEGAAITAAWLRDCGIKPPVDHAARRTIRNAIHTLHSHGMTAPMFDSILGLVRAVYGEKSAGMLTSLCDTAGETVSLSFDPGDIATQVEDTRS